MMKNKKITLLASILVMTLVAGVYAAVRLSNPITTSWTLRESGTTLELYWAAPYGAPTGDLNRGGWIYASIGLRNNGLATYTVLDWFKIYTAASGLPSGCVTIEYYDGASWLDMTGVLTGYGSNTLTGYFGPITGFPVGPGYDVVSSFRIMFNGNAPINVGYTFEAWVEQI
jgi:hypothetical protein